MTPNGCMISRLDPILSYDHQAPVELFEFKPQAHLQGQQPRPLLATRYLAGEKCRTGTY